MLDRTESHSLDPLAISPSAIYLSIDGLIDLKTDELTGWVPNYLRSVGIGAENKFPNRIYLQLDFSVEWSRFGEGGTF